MVRTRTFQSIWLEKYPEKTISKETEEKIYNGHHSYSYTNDRKIQYGTTHTAFVKPDNEVSDGPGFKQIAPP